MTIPGMNANVQRKELNAGVKKAYATLNGALDKAQVELGYLPQCYLPHTWATSGTGTPKLSGCVALSEAMMKTLNTARICEGNAKEKGCVPDYKGRETVRNPDATQEEQDQITNSAGCWPYNKTQIDNNKTIYVLADGMIIIPYAPNWTPAVIAVDVNGKQGPNRWGYDVFEFSLLYDDGGLQFNGTGQCSMVESGGHTARDILLNKI